jgi:hypothetical protein
MRAKISEEIDLKHVPKEFGGDCECPGGCWFGHPSEKALNAFARKLNGEEEEEEEEVVKEKDDQEKTTENTNGAAKNASSLPGV